MEALEISKSNSEKLDRLLTLLEGDKNVPGVFATVQRHEMAIEGDGDGRLGLRYKVTVMWRVHVWLLCSISAAAGYILKTLIHS